MTLCIGQQHPVTVYSTAFWVCVVLVLSVITISLIEFYFIMTFIMIVLTIIGVFMAMHYLFNYTLGFL